MLLFFRQSYLSEGEKWYSSEESYFLYEKENKEIVLAGIQLRKKSIDFRTMSDKILTRKKAKKQIFRRKNK